MFSLVLLFPGGFDSTYCLSTLSNSNLNIVVKKTNHVLILSPKTHAGPFPLLAQASWMETAEDKFLLEFDDPFGPLQYEETKIKVNANAAVEAFTGSK